ncbi:MAG: DMT family transporter [Pseudomonadota bacterium]
MSRSHSILIPILVIMLGIFLLDLMGVFIRILSATYPAQELAVLRNLFGMVPSVILLWTLANWHERGRPLRIRQWKLAFARGLFVSFAQLCFYVALTKLEFATATTLAYAGPMIVTALSVPVLGERVGPWRWAAVVIGFAGILLIMRPGTDAFTLWALLPLGAAAGYAVSAVLVRLIDQDVPSPLVNLYANLSAMVGAAVLTLLMVQPVAIQSWHDLGLIAAMGCSGGAGVLCLTYAYRMTQPAILAPFEYTGIIFAFGLGWLVFNEAPFATLFPGVLLIVGAGLLIVWREQKSNSAIPYPRPSRRHR